MKTLPTYFLSHGGGPWPFMDGAFRRNFDNLQASLEKVPRELGVLPEAILMISGHWEEKAFTVGSGAQPGMIYDYSGFPPNTYSVKYEAPGSPEVAQRVRALLEQANLPVRLDAERGFDHGTFTPLAVMYPKAEVPVVQLSLKAGYDPEEHLALGRALRPLRDEGVLIVGSGLSWHNLGLFGPGAREPSEAFDRWLSETLDAPGTERSRRLTQWSSAPSARIAHPQEDHFIPLMVAVGAAEGEAATRIYHEQGFMGGVTASSYRFGDILG